MLVMWSFHSVLQRIFDPDEFEHLHAARSISNGLKVYRDFFEHHMPLQYLFFVPLHHIWGDTETFLMSGRFIMFGFMLLTLLTTFFLAREFLNTEFSLFAVILMAGSYAFRRKAIEVRPDNIMVPLILIGLFFLLRSMKKSSWINITTAGVFFGLSVWASVKGALFIVAFLIPWMFLELHRHRFKEVFARSCFLSTGIISICLIGTVIVYRIGILPDLIKYNFVHNLGWKYRFSVFRSLFEIIHNDPVILALFLAGWIATLSILRKTKCNDTSLLLLCFSLTILVVEIVMIIPNPYLQNFLLPVPLFSILASHRIHTSLSCKPEDNSHLRFLIFWLLLSLGFSISALWGPLQKSGPMTALQTQTHIVTCVLSLGIAVLFALKPRFARLGMIVLLIWPVYHILVGEPSRDRQFHKLRLITDLAGDDGAVLDSWTGYGVLTDHAGFFPFLHIGIQQHFGKDIQRSIKTLLDSDPPEIILLDASFLDTGLGLLDTIESCYRWDPDLKIWILSHPDDESFDIDEFRHHKNRKGMNEILRRYD
jgi:Dolichyl-phosphate-mannose-protein mannosyltransferase